MQPWFTFCMRGSTLKMYVTLALWQLANEEAAVVKSRTEEVICYPFQPWLLDESIEAFREMREAHALHRHLLIRYISIKARGKTPHIHHGPGHCYTQTWDKILVMHSVIWSASLSCPSLTFSLNAFLKVTTDGFLPLRSWLIILKNC